MRAAVECSSDLFDRQHRADRHAAAERLGERDDVGPDAVLLVREQGAGASHADLYLVEQQQQSFVVAEVP